jgi:putative tryptophan/tyrosine transport system substrate-binding protein
MRRREFITAVAASAITWPLEQVNPVIGQLWHAGSAEEEGKYFVAVIEGFRQLGYVEGHNIAFECRFPAEQYERYNSFAAELVALRVDVLMAVTGPAASAAKRATTTIPIVFVLVPDPVESKLVDSLARPGGNITGFSNIATDLSAKRLQIFKQTIPNLSRAALLVNSNDPNVARRTIDDILSAAAILNLTVEPIRVRAADDLKTAFSAIANAQLQGVVLPFDGMLYNARKQIAELAVAHRLPTIHVTRGAVESGMLMSYGANHEEIFRRSPIYVDKILRGAKLGDLPVEQPTRLELVVNLTTAKALGLTIPPSVLTLADEVVE